MIVQFENGTYSKIRKGTITYHCSNPLWGKAFDKPKIVYVFPFCLEETKEKKLGCQHRFDYLGKREDDEGIPNECAECEKPRVHAQEEGFFSKRG